MKNKIYSIGLAVILIVMSKLVMASAYMAPNMSSYSAGHNVDVNRGSYGNYDNYDYYDEGYYDPYFFPMYGYGAGIDIPLGGSGNSNSNKYGSQDTYQSPNITNDSNGEVTFSQ